MTEKGHWLIERAKNSVDSDHGRVVCFGPPCHCKGRADAGSGGETCEFADGRTGVERRYVEGATIAKDARLGPPRIRGWADLGHAPPFREASSDPGEGSRTGWPTPPYPDADNHGACWDRTDYMAIRCQPGGRR